MKIPLLLPVVLLLLVLSSTSSKPISRKNKNTDSALSFVNDFMSPHSSIFENVKQKTIADFQALRTYIHRQITGDVDDKEERLVFVSRDARADDNQDRRLIDDEDSQSDRNLAASCQNNGKATTAKVNIYTCNGQTVSKDTYMSLNGNNCTVAKSVTTDVCYCSYEYYGDSCETLNTFSLEIARLSNPGDCTGQDTFNYVYSYNGVPPCYPVSSGSTVTMINKIVAQTQDSSYNFEGVKPSLYDVVEQPNVGSNPFTYVVNGETIKLTASSVPSTPSFQILFMNWLRISTPTTIKASLTPAQIAGTDNVTTTITFDSSMTELAYSGRYYYELSTTANSGSTVMSKGYYGGYFEQAGYKEPTAAKKPHIGLIVGLSILGAILLVGAIWGYRLCKARKNGVPQETEGESDPLMVYAAQEEAPSPMPNINRPSSR